MANYGRTWWGEKWLDALKGIDHSNRLSRGRTYANTGRVYDIKFNDNIINAKVEGNYASYYKVTVMPKSFTQDEKEIIAEVINNHPSILSALLNKKLPEELYHELSKIGIKIFPTSWREINADCNCPDYVMPCKHMAGLIYMISVEIDKNPFKAFEIRDCDLKSMIDHLDDIEEEKVRKIKNIEDILLETKNTSENNNSKEKNISAEEDGISTEKLTEVDFSKISDISNHTLAMLKENPIFYDKDFKDILERVYKSLAKYTKKTCRSDYSNKDYYMHGIILKTKINKLSKIKKLKDESDDEWKDRYYQNKWDDPVQWETLNIIINENYKISETLTNKNKSLNTSEISNNKNKHPFTEKNHENLNQILAAFLLELYQSNIHKYNYNIQYLYLLTQFTIKLIENKSIMPELLEVNNHFIIRWIPCLFNKDIDKICENLYELCPQNLITYEKKEKRLKAEEQVKIAISLIISGIFSMYIKNGLPQYLKRQIEHPIFQLFFGGEGKNFKEYETHGYEFLIDQWLSNLHIGKRNYDLYLTIDESSDDSFNINLEVSIDDNSPEPVYNIISDKKNYKITDKKLQLLSDIYLIQDYLPEIAKSIDLKKPIEFNLEEFSSFFIDIIPLLEIMGISMILPKSLQKVFKPQLTLNIESKTPGINEKAYLSLTELVKFNWELAIGDKKISINEFEKLLKKSEGLVKLANQYVILDKKEVKSLLNRLNKISDKLNQYDLTQAILSGEFQDTEVNIDSELESMVEKITTPSKLPIPNNLNAELRPYQERGFSWLGQNIDLGFGSILADDMGLGKTIQVLALILHLKNHDSLEKKVLVIAPTSLLFNWQREIEKFTPTLNSYIYHGQNRKIPKEDCDIVISSYGMIRSDEKKFKKEKWFLLVIDEAQNIKNPLAKQTKAIKSIKADNKIALSGTPVENRLADYWSIFDFTNKHYLSTAKKFTQRFVIPIEKERDKSALDTFKMITKPFILRRLKSDKNIIADLPDKIVNDIYCNLSPKQTALYQEMVDSVMEEIDTSEGISRKGLIFK
ncbi:MAG: DEAD/DEAH box helicase, partial [Methanobrevibacter sp.]|nr:DEAD/DEAH box helicase [Candidatus Methanoflexus mossambicus]